MFCFDFWVLLVVCELFLAGFACFAFDFDGGVNFVSTLGCWILIDLICYDDLIML